MLAMIHVLVRDGLVDQPYVDEHTVGYPELVDHVSRLDARAGRGDLRRRRRRRSRRLARDWGTIRPAAIRTLIGAEHHENGAMFHRTLAVLPALVGAWQDRGGGLARSVGSWQDALVDEGALDRPDLLPGPLPRDDQHEPPRRGCSPTPTLDPPDRGAWSCGTATRRSTNPNAEPSAAASPATTCSPSSTSSSSPTPPATPTSCCRRRRRSRPTTSCWRGATCGWAGTSRPSRRSARRASNTELFRRLAGGHGPAPSRRCSTTTRPLLQPGARVRRSTSTSCAGSGWIRVPYPEDGRPWGAGVFPTASGRIELVSEQLAGASASRRCRRSCRRARVRAAIAELLARYPLQLLTPKHHSPLPELRLLAAAQARPGRGRPVRRARRRTTPPPAAWPTATSPGSGTTGRASPCRSR